MGFEYERCDSGYEYFKDTFPRGIDLDLFYNHPERFLPYFRVKHLDHDDIVACGWDSGLDDIGYGIVIGSNEKMTLRPFIGSTLVEIQRNKKLENGRELINTKFLGTILNKSELKFIMSRIGINQQP